MNGGHLRCRVAVCTHTIDSYSMYSVLCNVVVWSNYGHTYVHMYVCVHAIGLYVGASVQAHRCSGNSL